MTGDEQARWVRLIVRSLKDAGVARAVICPGSRSGPLALALSAAFPSEVIVDERSAAFCALGQVAATGEPTVVCCTSGSAAAHFLPAVIEASQVGLPLVVLTADRPWELRHVGASQTIDQRNLFGTFARASVEVGVADEVARAQLPFLIARTVSLALTSPGPVHLNVELRKPLEPEGPWDDGDIVGARAPRISSGDVTPNRATVARLAAILGASERGAIVLGPADGSARREDVLRRRAAVRTFAAKTQFAVIAEATSGVRFLAEPSSTVGAELAIRAPALREALAPDVVVEVGLPMVGRDHAAWTRATRDKIVLASSVARDPSGGATEIVLGDQAAVLEALAEALGAVRASQAAYRADMTRLSRVALDAVMSKVLAEPWSEIQAMKTLVDLFTDGTTLLLGNSLPVRDIDLFAAPRAVDVAVIHQRGAAGIDGLIAKAAGARVVSDPTKPVVLVLGDVSALHDVGSLALLARLEAPLVVVVMNNGGGRIFEELPVAKREDVAAKFGPLFLTPPPSGFIEGAARAFGVAHEGVEDIASLRDAYTFATRRPKTTVLEARFGESSQALRRVIDETLHTLRP